MILYANGCSHTAAAEAVVPDAFAVDDGRAGIDRRPHPENLAASWCTILSQSLGADIVCQAESASSNDRILRTTKTWIEFNRDVLPNTLIAIQWTTWEREEWLWHGHYYQVNASGKDWVPKELANRYKSYVMTVDYRQKTQEWHEKIWRFHCWLRDQNIKHVMFNGWNTFRPIHHQQNWHGQYLDPYSDDHSYSSVLKNNGFECATPDHGHFRADGHRFWAQYLLQYINRNQLLT